MFNAVINKIYWDRIHCYFEIECDSDGKTEYEKLGFFLIDSDNHVELKLRIVSRKDNRFLATFNVTNNGHNDCIKAGLYRIYAVNNNTLIDYCLASTDILSELDNYSRSYLYNNNRNIYSAVFSIDEGDDRLPLVIRFFKSGDRNAENHLNKATAKRFIYNFFRFFHGKNRNKKVLFLSEQSPLMKANLKAVYAKMMERGLDKQFKISVSTRAGGRRYPIYSWIKVIRKLSAADVIFVDDHVPLLDYIRLKDTKVIQLWHAGAGFKNVGYSRWGHKACPAPMSCHRQYKYGITASRGIAHFFSEVWGMEDEYVLPTGMPRMDEFLDEEYRKNKEKELYERYPLCKGKKVILFAPTYRGKVKRESYYPYDRIDFGEMYDLCQDEYVVLFKMHPFITEPVPIAEKYRDRMMDVGDYLNINDLFYITDLLITDYSSNIFEYSLMNKPMLFYAFDEIIYSFSRGFHRDYKEAAPGKICHTFDELIDAVRDEDFEFHKVKEYVEKHFDYIDSNASNRVIDWALLEKFPESVLADFKKLDDIQEEIKSLQQQIKEHESV